MRTGPKTQRIEIQKKGPETAAGIGRTTWQWVPLRPVAGDPTRHRPLYAEWTDLRAARDEDVVAGLVVGISRARVRVDWCSDIDQTMRVVRLLDSGNLMYSIIGGPDVIGRREWTELVVELYSS